MKEYKKPAMMALSISANDALCYGCSAKTRFDTDLSTLLEIEILGKYDDGFFTWDEAASVGAFASATDSCSKIEVDFSQYCKFTAADEGLTQLFTS